MPLPSRSPLFNRTEVPRERRAPMRLIGRCSLGEGAPQEVLVVDLTANGCRLLGISAGVSRGEQVTLWLGAAGPIAGRLKWAKKASVGVAFDQPVDIDPAG